MTQLCVPGEAPAVCVDYVDHAVHILARSSSSPLSSWNLDSEAPFSQSLHHGSWPHFRWCSGRQHLRLRCELPQTTYPNTRAPIHAMHLCTCSIVLHAHAPSPFSPSFPLSLIECLQDGECFLLVPAKPLLSTWSSRRASSRS